MTTPDATKAKTEIVNAIIESAEICISRGFIVDCWLSLDYGGSGQSFGGYVLGFSDRDNMDMPNFAGEWLAQCMNIAAVEKFSQMKGKTIRVRKDGIGFNTSIVAIGHITKDIWFNPTEVFARAQAAADAAEQEQDNDTDK